MQENHPNVVSLLEHLAARAQQRGEPVEPLVKRLVVGVGRGRSSRQGQHQPVPVGDACTAR